MFKSISAGLVLAVTCFTSTTVAQADVVTDWNAFTLRCVQGAPGLTGNRTGPVGLLDIALVQAAVHDAVQAIEGRYEAYRYSNPNLLGAGSTNAAAASASYRMLVGLYGAGNACLVGVPNPSVTYAGDGGLQAGTEAAAVMLPLYRPTFVSPIDPFVGGTEPGQWRPTPNVTMAANTFMAYTEPFTLKSTRQFRPQPPPPMVSEVYAREYNEVKSLGRIGSNSARTPEQTDLAMFWFTNPISAWFGTLRGIAIANINNVGDSARLFALAGMASADGQMTVYETKAHYNFWRPITAIWFGDDDGNPDTAGDPTWMPLMQTPPYADHSSGANCLASSILSTVELVLGTDAVNFSITSSIAGLTTNPRVYSSVSTALDDVVDVRILQGIHFRSADIEGRRQGARVAHWAYQRFLRPR